MTMLFMLFSLLGELRSTQGDYDTGDAFWFIALTTPRMAYQMFPVSALLGALVGVGGLAAMNELVAFRTAGVSRMRLAVAALAGAMLLTLPVMIMGEWLAPVAEQQARAFRLSEKVGQAIIGGPRGMWMRDGENIVNIQLPLLSANRGEQSVAAHFMMGNHGHWMMYPPSYLIVTVPMFFMQASRTGQLSSNLSFWIRL
jgi:lipopolysaccharide export LptBFGC system permease protein LptF